MTLQARFYRERQEKTSRASAPPAPSLGSYANADAASEALLDEMCEGGWWPLDRVEAWCRRKKMGPLAAPVLLRMLATEGFLEIGPQGWKVRLLG